MSRPLEDWEMVEGSMLGPLVHYARPPEVCSLAEGKGLPWWAIPNRVEARQYVTFQQEFVTCPYCQENLRDRRGQWY